MWAFLSPDQSVIRYHSDPGLCPTGWTCLPLREEGDPPRVGEIGEPGPVTITDTEVIRVGVIRPETEAERAARLATPISRLTFNLLLTQTERIGIRASTDDVVIDFLDLLSMAQDIVLSNPLTVAGVLHMEDVGLLDAGRSAQILGGIPPA